MNDEVLFTESQRFKQWWLWLILLVIDGFLLYGILWQVLMGHPIGDRPMTDKGLLAAAGLMTLMTILFASIRLESRITMEGINVKFFPFQLSFRKYSWNQVSKSFVRKYNPISEYGGWGIRLGFFGKGNALNISGNKGLQLEFTNNKKLLIGTNKPAELTAALGKIGQLKL